MTHEVKKIFQEYGKRGTQEAAVLATVVALDGSSYRRPGVRMLIFESGTMVGAVSGGCVEKEVLRQAQSVFKTEIPKVMVYDGRYRLGCEGVLYILLEIFRPEEELREAFADILEKRGLFSVHSHFLKEQIENPNFGSAFQIGENVYPISGEIQERSKGLHIFSQEMKPCFQLVIIGSEHDAVQLCSFAARTGWEVTVIAGVREEKTKIDFPGTHKLIQTEPELFQPTLDQQSAVVIMTHSFAKDLQYLVNLRDIKVDYIGLLGPYKRREKLFDALLERHPELTEDFLDQIHGPAGLDIGAETPQEIAVSILSEILTVRNKKKPQLLRNKMGKIHT